VSWWQRLFRRAPANETREEGLPDAPVHVARDLGQEAAIARVLDGDADAELAVYGDWLVGQGDPRGELVAIQSKLEHAAGEWTRKYHPTTIEPFRVPAGPLAGDAAALIARHRRHFLGVQQAKRDGMEPVEWHAGFWRRLRFHPEDDSARRRGELAALLDHPSAALLRGLWVGTAWGEPIADLLPDRLPPTLCELYLGDFEFPEESELSWTIVGDATPIYQRAPQLERLVLQGLAAVIGAPIELPHLRSLEIITTHLDPAAIRALVASPFAELEQLVLWTGEELDDPQGADVDLHELLARPFPKLRHLGIRNCAESDAVVAALVDSPLISGLRTLDLSLGTLTPAGARVLEQARDRIQLDWLDLSENGLAGYDVSDLDALAPTVVIGEQGPAGAERYAPITE
jgi:hypothetical protein